MNNESPGEFVGHKWNLKTLWRYFQEILKIDWRPLWEETKEICHLKPNRVCETKTQTYKVVTGYEDGECKEIEVCKFPGFHHRRRRSAEPGPHYGHIECEKETKEVCKKEPVVEEKSKDFELCHIEPEKVCEEKTIKVPTLDCEEEEEEE